MWRSNAIKVVSISIFFAISGCACKTSSKPYGELQSAVKKPPYSSKADTYIFDYCRNDLGFSKELKEETLTGFLEIHQQMPTECKRGIVITKRGDGENGYSFVEFQCK